MDVFSTEKRSDIMRRVKSNNTKPEQKLKKALFHRGWRYRKNVKNLAGKPDIVFTKYKVVVFVHGCFWHQHPGCKSAERPKSRTDYWESKLSRNVLRDVKTRETLISAGWTIVVIWECEMRRDFDAVIERVEGVLKSKIKEPS